MRIARTLQGHDKRGSQADRRRRLWLVPLAIAAAANAHAAGAADSHASALVVNRAWSIDLPEESARLRQTLVGASVSIEDLHPQLRLRAYVPVAWSRDGSEGTEINGLGDAQIRASWQGRGRPWSLQAGLDLPSGKTALTLTEARVASRMLASRVLDFNLKRPGEGLDFMLGASTARPIGRNTVAGLAVAGHVKGAYTLYEDDGGEQKAEPGHRLHVALSLLAREHPDDPNWTLDMTLAAQAAGEYVLRSDGDRGEVTIDEGLQVTLDGRYRRRVSDVTHVGLFAYLMGRDRNRAEGATVAEIEALGVATRWLAEVGASYERSLEGIADLGLRFSHGLYTLDPEDELNSRTSTVEVNAQRALGEAWQLRAFVGLSFGRTSWSDDDAVDAVSKHSITGTHLGLTARWTL